MMAHAQFSANELAQVVTTFNQCLNHDQLSDITLKALILITGKKQKEIIKFERLNDLTDAIVQLFKKNKDEIVLISIKTMYCLISRYPNQF